MDPPRGSQMNIGSGKVHLNCFITGNSRLKRRKSHRGRKSSVSKVEPVRIEDSFQYEVRELRSSNQDFLMINSARSRAVSGRSGHSSLILSPFHGGIGRFRHGLRDRRLSPFVNFLSLRMFEVVQISWAERNEISWNSLRRHDEDASEPSSKTRCVFSHPRTWCSRFGTHRKTPRRRQPHTAPFRPTRRPSTCCPPRLRPRRAFRRSSRATRRARRR